MIIPSGSTVQLFLTIDGTPYAKTETIPVVISRKMDFIMWAEEMAEELYDDIDKYADET